MELVTLLDEDGAELGSAPKDDVHTTDTPLHLAFSCYLVDDHGRLLVTRRALSKRTWPGVWTNSFCGHPAPGEAAEDAIQRRAAQELGTRVASLRVVLPGYRYRAVDASGIVENEICPVYVGRIDAALRPEPAEVAEHAWISVEDAAHAVRSAPFAFSPWLREQLPLLVQANGFLP
ncbi:isopentenyl-diphosphate Delta-isomerase [Microbacterium nymphoidis]|jgi:isopentenyl-diphosphate Delta-isomerase|uniref:isopentenyl-diphosphate Delta-isomerase n=1 Tax=Microbacterium nymphoidis TaxID=2898586 RepID=UPI001E3CF6F6|nr:isopentenyl-diphosphate Delta-isomerase [Microbacterium nymphoidis]MCD2499128.1 isopentenyl-diphosphate Delta-isomerase [Microbacterium nymphoidis]